MSDGVYALQRRVDAALGAGRDTPPDRAGTTVLLVGAGSADAADNAEVARTARLLWEGRGLRGRGDRLPRHGGTGRARGPGALRSARRPAHRPPDLPVGGARGAGAGRAAGGRLGRGTPRRRGTARAPRRRRAHAAGAVHRHRHRADGYRRWRPLPSAPRRRRIHATPAPPPRGRRRTHATGAATRRATPRARPGAPRRRARSGTPRAWSTSPSTSAPAPRRRGCADRLAASLDGLAALPGRPAPRAGRVAARHGRAGGARCCSRRAPPRRSCCSPARCRRPAARWWCTRSSPSRRRRCGTPGTRCDRVLLRAADGFRLDPAAVPDDADLVVSATRPTRPRCCTRPPPLAALARPGPDARRRRGVHGRGARRARESLAARARPARAWWCCAASPRPGAWPGCGSATCSATRELRRRLRRAQPLWAVSTPGAGRRRGLLRARGRSRRRREAAAGLAARPRPPAGPAAPSSATSRSPVPAQRPLRAAAPARRGRRSAPACATSASRCAAATPSRAWAPTGCGSRSATPPPPTASPRPCRRRWRAEPTPAGPSPPRSPGSRRPQDGEADLHEGAVAGGGLPIRIGVRVTDTAGQGAQRRRGRLPRAGGADSAWCRGRTPPHRARTGMASTSTNTAQGHRVDGEDVDAAVQDHGGRIRENLGQTHPDVPSADLRPAALTTDCGLARLNRCTRSASSRRRAGHGPRHRFRGVGHPPAFQTDAVVHARSGRERGLPRRSPGTWRSPGVSSGLLGATRARRERRKSLSSPLSHEPDGALALCKADARRRFPTASMHCFENGPSGGGGSVFKKFPSAVITRR